MLRRSGNCSDDMKHSSYHYVNVNDAASFFDANTELNMQKHLSMFLTSKAGHLSIMPALRTT